MKNNLIMLIGSDGSGKSTLAKGLNKELGYEVFHFGPANSYEEGKKEYFNFIKNKNENMVLDRFFEGEAIYAPIYRNYSGADYFPELEKAMKEKFNVLLVLIEPPFEIIEKRLLERGEDFVKREDWHYAYCKMREFFYESTLPKIRISSYDYTPEENINYIISKI